MKRIKVMKTFLSLTLLIFSLLFVAACEPAQLREVVGALEEISESLEEIAGEPAGQEDPATGNQQVQDAAGATVGIDTGQSDSQVPGAGWIDLKGFIRAVHSARWSIVSPDCHDGIAIYTYEYEGKETVGGVKADRVTGTYGQGGQTVTWQLWAAEDGRLLRMINDGEEVDESYRDFASLALIPPLTVFAWPDPVHDREFKQTLAGESVPGWNLQSFERQAAKISGVSAHFCDVTFIHASYDNQPATFRYGDFGTFNLIIEYHLAYGGTQTMKTEALTFR